MNNVMRNELGVSQSILTEYKEKQCKLFNRILYFEDSNDTRRCLIKPMR